jgi:gamma-glutamyltranspeptidase / glutathione hydrolase
LPKKQAVIVVFFVGLVISLLIFAQQSQLPAAVGFAPGDWPKQDLERYSNLQHTDAYLRGQLPTSATSSKAMIASTSEPLAIHAGFEALRHGGNAADAALTTSLAQISLSTGAAYSYAGIMLAVYYDASSGKVYTLNAAYNTVKGETDPMSIPAFGQHSGRTALVPGFMAGVQALHNRFGKLPFKKLFEPAIWIADNGVPFSPLVDAWLKPAGPFVTRLPASKRVFTKENGEFYKVGELFRQPELAATLKKVSSEGSSYMYRGDWAKHFVEAVQREGGKMTMDDLAAYEPVWTDPAVVNYNGYQIVSLGEPSAGGLLTQWSFSLAEEANLKQLGHYTTSADSLYSLIQISREAQRLAFGSLPVSKEMAAAVWRRIQEWKRPVPEEAKPSSNHSAAVIVVDEQGNVASVLHSINGLLWGSTGIFVDGVSIPDSASIQQQLVRNAGPGKRLPETTNPLIVLKGGKPVLASGAVGSGLHQVTLQNVINVLDFGMDVTTAVASPNTQGPYVGQSITGPGQPQYQMETVSEGAFSAAILDGVRARGQAIKIIAPSDRSQLGYWVGIQIVPETHKMNGAVTSLIPGMVEGY